MSCVPGAGLRTSQAQGGPVSCQGRMATERARVRTKSGRIQGQKVSVILRGLSNCGACGLLSCPQRPSLLRDRPSACGFPSMSLYNPFGTPGRLCSRVGLALCGPSSGQWRLVDQAWHLVEPLPVIRGPLCAWLCASQCCDGIAGQGAGRHWPGQSGHGQLEPGRMGSKEDSGKR